MALLDWEESFRTTWASGTDSAKTQLVSATDW